MSSLFDQLAGRLALLTTLPITDELRQAVRFRVADTLAACELGLQLNQGETARPSTPTLAQLIAAARFTEADDIHIRSCTTAGAVVVPVVLRVADDVEVDDEDVIVRLVIAGYEAFARLAAALDGPRVLFEGWWPTCLCAPAAVAAIRCVIGQADANPISRALETASARAIEVASAKEWSLQALGELCARELDRRPSVPWASTTTAFGGLPLAADALGAEWQILSVETKSFPSSRQALPAVEALMAARAERPDAEIERVVVEVPEPIRQMVEVYPPRTRIESLVSIRHQLARAFEGVETLNDAARASLTLSSRATEFAECVEVREAADLTSRYPAQWPARVRVRWKHGSAVVQEVAEPRGSAQSPLSWPALREKWRRIFDASGVTHRSFEELIDTAQQSVALASLTTMEGSCLG